jgi:hypothetical protein
MTAVHSSVVSRMIRIEFEPPHQTTCECCGAETTRLTRFVHEDHAAYAVYYAAYGREHPDEVKAVVSVGKWGEGSTPSDRIAVPLTLWQNDSEHGVTVVDASDSPWNDVELLGRMLNREEALTHPRINDIFHITDHIFAEDPEIRAFFASTERHVKKS